MSDLPEWIFIATPILLTISMLFIEQSSDWASNKAVFYIWGRNIWPNAPPERKSFPSVQKNSKEIAHGVCV